MRLLKKTIPDTLKDEIGVPNMDYIYFNNIEKFPFSRQELSYSKVNAWWLS